MNASDLTNRLADRLGLTRKAARAYLDAALDEIGQALARGEHVTLSGFGTFEVRQRAGRTGRHPRTHEPLVIPARRSAAFRPGLGLRRALTNRQ